MKVLVLYDNEGERPLAENLVQVLKTIGAMLVYGKVTNNGVLLEDWASKPKVKMDCYARPGTPVTPAMTSDRPGSGEGVYGAYTDAVGYANPYANPRRDLKFDITGSYAKSVVKDFLDLLPKNNTKPIVPKPDTTPTGVTVRELDIWDEDDHGNPTD